MHVEYFIQLFAIATGVAVAARWVRIPYTVALVLTGLLLGASHALPAIVLTRELLFSFILPALIFEAAFHLDVARFWRDKLTINAMATPGLVLTTGLTAVILVPLVNALGLVHGFGWIHGILFATLIGATDPIAVVAMFKSLGAPKRLTVLVEGESLLNDGTGVVLFTIALAAATGTHYTLLQAAGEFVRVAGLGALVGAAFGFGMSQLIRRIDDAMIELTLTVVTAYGSFVVAERLGVSGVIATVAAGMLCGNYAARVGMSPTTRVAVETFWDYAAFALNSVVFLLIGLEVNLVSLLHAWAPILAAYLAVMVARAAVVYLVSALLRPTRARLPLSWSAVITWSGLRGALSMVLVLGLPIAFPNRPLLVNMTFGVVVLSILVQALTMGPLMRRLGVVSSKTEAQSSFEQALGHFQAASAGLAELDRMAHEHGVPRAMVERLRGDYRTRAEAAEAELAKLSQHHAGLGHEASRVAQRRLLAAERAAVVDSAHRGLISPDTLDHLIADVDARLDRLEQDVPDAPRATELAALPEHTEHTEPRPEPPEPPKPV